MLDIAHRTACGELSVVRIKRRQQRIERIVEERLFARIPVVKPLSVGALVIGERLPGIHQPLNGVAESRMTADYVGRRSAVEQHLQDRCASSLVLSNLARL